MAATIYAPPDHIPAPDFDAYFGRKEDGSYASDSTGYFEACKEFQKAVSEWCQENGNGALKGKTWRYQIADGYAEYVVYTTRPLALIDVGDDYSIPEVLRKGLTASSLKDEIERGERLSAIFSRGDAA